MFTLTQMRRLQSKQNNELKLVLDVNKWAPTSNIHAELRILPLALRVEVFQANMFNKLLLNQKHPLREHLSDKLFTPRPRNAKHKLTWLSILCREHHTFQRKRTHHLPAITTIFRPNITKSLVYSITSQWRR